MHQVTESLGDPLVKWGHDVSLKGDREDKMASVCAGFSSHARLANAPREEELSSLWTLSTAPGCFAKPP